MTILIDEIEDYNFGVRQNAKGSGWNSHDELGDVVVHVYVALESLLASDWDKFDQYHVADFIVEVLQGDKLTPEVKQFIKEQIGEIK